MDRYLLGKVDLRYVFDATPSYRYYFADLGLKEKPIKLRRAKSTEIDESTLPEEGIFSTAHTHPIAALEDSYNDRQRFNIDGVWEARDFSQFHGKMADTYSLLFIAQKLDADNTTRDEVGFLRASISERPWQGGGSYLSFYGGMKSDARSVHPLRVAGIEYHSPGYVELEGKREVLDEILEAIRKIVSDNSDQIAKNYSAIHKSLKHEGLLGAGREGAFLNEGTESYVRRQALRLAGLTALPNAELIWEACDRNTAVFAKLVLSYCRRLRQLASFVVEGRVKFD
ncbi:MAG: hypothetical protein KJ947_22445 [Alphaproteobacteria bacterium]|nr:hypothetical protein [Alphaproteobacteria bacterium]MBU1552308.1 hypothetical protein [Alphaproteobacteria bacterium]